MKNFILNEENLRKIGACKEGIDFLKRNNLIGLDFHKLDITGDYENYVSWLEEKLNYEYKYDEKGNVIWQKNPNGTIYEWEYKYDKKDRLIEIIKNNESTLKINIK